MQTFKEFLEATGRKPDIRTIFSSAKPEPENLRMPVRLNNDIYLAYTRAAQSLAEYTHLIQSSPEAHAVNNELQDIARKLMWTQQRVLGKMADNSPQTGVA